MSGILSGSGGGGGFGGGGGADGGGLCVFSCAAVVSAFGAVAALYGLDLGPETTFFAISGLGALCFTKCQYLRLIQQRNSFKKRGGLGEKWENPDEREWNFSNISGQLEKAEHKWGGATDHDEIYRDSSNPSSKLGLKIKNTEHL